MRQCPRQLGNFAPFLGSGEDYWRTEAGPCPWMVRKLDPRLGRCWRLTGSLSSPQEERRQHYYCTGWSKRAKILHLPNNDYCSLYLWLFSNKRSLWQGIFLSKIGLGTHAHNLWQISKSCQNCICTPSLQLERHPRRRNIIYGKGAFELQIFLILW